MKKRESERGQRESVLDKNVEKERGRNERQKGQQEEYSIKRKKYRNRKGMKGIKILISVRGGNLITKNIT